MVDPRSNGKTTLKRYLARYALQDIQQLTTTLQAYNSVIFKQCICVPAFAESNIQKVWSQLLEQPYPVQPYPVQPWLVIILWNSPNTASVAERDIHEQAYSNTLHNEFFKKHTTLLSRKDNFAHWHLFMPQPQAPNNSSWPYILSINLTATLPHKQGVGLARRYLSDIACGLIAQGQIDSQWFGMTDADARLPEHYLQQLAALNQQIQSHKSLALFAFKHDFHKDDLNSEHNLPINPQQPLVNQQHTKDKLLAAHRLYEQFMQTYRDALFAVMPEYGFTALGSILAINSVDYAHVRGFPLRAAGEDFYLMNKMIKLNGVLQLSGQPIILEPRVSHRTPFGTGQSIDSILEAQTLDEVPIFYAQNIIKQWQTQLSSIRELVLTQQVDTISKLSLGVSVHTKWLARLITQCQQTTSQQQRHQVLIDNLDGLRCLQLLRILHADIPRISLQQLRSSH